MESHSAGIPAGRFYKSRKSRPCDACRRRKVACDMPSGPPCLRCSTRSLACTFENGPGKRKRREIDAEAPPMGQPIGQDVDDMHNAFYLGEPMDIPGASPTAQASHLFLQDFSLPDTGLDLAGFTGIRDEPCMNYQELGSYPSRSDSGVSPSQASVSRKSGDGPSPGASSAGESYSGGSLELVPDAFSFYIGPTGTADIHLLLREEFDGNEITRPKIRGLKYRRLGRDHAPQSHGLPPYPAMFGITDQSLLSKAEPRLNEETIEHAWSEFWRIVDPASAWRLIRLYSRFVDPYFPILSTKQFPTSPDELSNMPLALLAAICAVALPFVVYDKELYSLLLHPPSSEQLYRLCWLDISQHLHSPTLSTLQGCLLLQQRLPTNAYLSDTAFAWSLMSPPPAVALPIGLHRDPMNWSSVPLWERKLRKRLWWALWSMEKWISLARGMPSHINDDDSDVSELTSDTFTDCLSATQHTSTAMSQLVKLTQILSDIQKRFYTVRAISQTSNDLQLSLESARILRSQLKSWVDNLPGSLRFLPRSGNVESGGGPADNNTSRADPSQDRRERNLAELLLDGSGSIHLSYIVTHMSLFRALLRPLEQWNTNSGHRPSGYESMHDGVKAVIRGSLLCVKNFVEFLETLTDVKWNAFWHSWSRPNFAIAGSFMVYLLHVISGFTGGGAWADLRFEEEDRELRDLVERWRITIRVSANGAAGARGLANLALLRVETMLGKLMASSGD